MQEIFQEYSAGADEALNLESEKGLIRDVKILGLTSRNGRTYPPEVLQSAAPLYEGAKVNVNHAENSACQARDYRDRIGSISHVIYKENAGLFADFHFNPNHPQARQLVWDARNAPQNVGFSHCVEAVISRRNESVVVEKIVRVISVDLVADPATTNGLFESEENTLTDSVCETEDCADRVIIPEENALIPLDDVSQNEAEYSEEQDAPIQTDSTAESLFALNAAMAELREEILALREEIARKNAIEPASPVCPPSAWQQNFRPQETLEQFVKSVRSNR